jgi:Cu(I)/Ag(I) efflux system membrane fusion protein
MRRLNSLLILAVGIFAGAISGYWLEHRPEPISTPAIAEQSPSAKEGRKILYYRNPMGHPDTSPVPKKDSMGMDYIPVYEDEQDEPGTVKVSPEKIQRTGVKTRRSVRTSSLAPCAALAPCSTTSRSSGSSRCAPRASSRI